MTDFIPIFYAADDCFIKYTLVSVTSLKANADPRRSYRVYILQTRVSEDYREAFESLMAPNFQIEFVDVSAYLDLYGDALHVRDYYSKTTYYRLFIAEMYPRLKKAIYLDSDTVVLGNIAELYDRDLGDNYVAAAPEQAMAAEVKIAANLIIFVHSPFCFLQPITVSPAFSMDVSSTPPQNLPKPLNTGNMVIFAGRNFFTCISVAARVQWSQAKTANSTRKVERHP